LAEQQKAIALCKKRRTRDKAGVKGECPPASTDL